MLRRHVLALTVALAVLLLGAATRADDKPTLTGSWTASGMSESWSFKDWGDACGPKQLGHGAGGGAVQVTQSGSELSMTGAGRSFSTSDCWEQMPGLSRTSHSGGGRSWRNTCATPANDPRQAQIVTTISATDTTISIQETGNYQFFIHGQTCTASVTRGRSLTRDHRDGEVPARATASAAAKPPARCTGSPGEAARLEVHPGKKLLRPGDHFAFRAAVLDAEGCAVGVRPAWRVLPGPLAEKVTLEPGGAVAIADDAAEGNVQIAVTLGDKGVTVAIEIASGENYDALLAARSAAGDAEEAATAVIASGTIGGKAGVAEDAAKARKLTFVAIVFGVAACLGFVGLIIARRGKHAEPARPSGIREGSTVPPEEPAEEEPPAPDGPSERPRRPRAPKGKICPTCGDRYPAEATFCGKDATQLVPLN